MKQPEQWLTTCPLCGGDNQCAITAGQPAETCWCAATSISATALAAIPSAAIAKKCICPSCGQAKGEFQHAR